MSSSGSLQISGKDKIFEKITTRKILAIVGGIGIVLIIIIFALTIATLAKVNRDVNQNPNDHTTSTTGPTTESPTTSDLAKSIRLEEVMSHLNELQRIATDSNGTRAINTPGFTQTVNYIANYLTANTDYKVNKAEFFVRDFALASNPILISSIDGVTRNYTYSSNPLTAEFYHIKYSTSTNFSDFIDITVIPNMGCSDDDWKNIDPPPEGNVALVKRGVCLHRDKAALAAKHNVAALLLYNDGATPDHVPPIDISLSQDNHLPALYLSYTVGQALADAALDPSKTPKVQIVIDAKELPNFSVENICADTPTGDVTQTIVIGSHSDSVPAGPGINDNGSGSAANLALAVALARLFRTSTYPKYKYRVRFCWWGAEEIGLLGSDYHVKQAKNSTVVGERLSDYLINLNYDMLGSPNYIFGIYDGRTARNDTPSQALPGSNKITDLFKDWFIKQNLPWDYTDFSGRSDYGPFLAEGIVAGGLFSGADDIKTQEERDRYDKILGQGLGGIPGIIHDPCYHLACDSIQNINTFVYERMVQAAAYVLEFLGQHEDLKTWLYPNGTGNWSDTEVY